MAMVWMQKNAKYFVITFGVLIAVGMMFMGPASQNTTQNVTVIGTINGVSLGLNEFRVELNQYQDQERWRS